MNDDYLKEKRERVATFAKLVRDLATTLRGSVRQAPSMEHDYYATIDTPTLPIHLATHSSNPGRIEASVSWPRDKQHNVITGPNILTGEERKAPPTLSISCSLARGAVKIANDIERRLIPSAAPIYARTLERCRANDEHEDGKAETLKRLRKALHCPQGERRDSESLYLDGGVTLRVSSADCVRFEYFYTDPGTAEKIVNLLKAGKREE